jgi:hypothetical protein
MEPVTIILGVIIILLVYFLYINYWKQNVLFEKINLNNSVPNITYASLSNPGSTRYSYGLWVYVNSWNTSQKNIISRGNDFSLYLDQTSPILWCKMGVKPDSSSANIIVTNNFPIQKWTHVIVSVDNNIIDFYIDGKLLLSKQINGIPVVSTADISFGGSSNSTGSTTTAPANSTSPDIFLAKVYRWVYPMDPQSAWNEYLTGNGQSLLIPNYNVQLELLKDNVVNKKYSLF